MVGLGWLVAVGSLLAGLGLGLGWAGWAAGWAGLVARLLLVAISKGKVSNYCM